MKKKITLNSIIADPLLHFLTIGAVLFIIYSLMNDADPVANNKIIITQNDLQNLATTWLKRVGRPPSAQERENQLKLYIREQVLSREAISIGLGQGDKIINRRLAQKMEYLFDDLSVIQEPTETQLAEYLTAHAEKFMQPASLSFSQIYFEPALHQDNVNIVAKKSLKQLQLENINNNAIDKGDRSLLPYVFNSESKAQIYSMFGRDFTERVFALPLNSWQGPVSSEYGVHLVYITSRTDAILPDLNDIRKSVASKWHNSKRKEANEIFYQSLFQRYQVVLDDEVTQSLSLNTVK